MSQFPASESDNTLPAHMRKMKAAKRMKLSEQTVTARQTKADCHLKEAALASAPVRGRPRVQVPSSNPAAAGSKQAEIPFTREQGARLKEENDALRKACHLHPRFPMATL